MTVWLRRLLKLPVWRRVLAFARCRVLNALNEVGLNFAKEFLNKERILQRFLEQV